MDTIIKEISESEYFIGGTSIKKFKYRTPEEKIKYCGRYMFSRRDTVTRLPIDVYEYPCNQKECIKCSQRKKYKKREQLKDRIKRANSSLFYKVVNNNKELTNLRKLCTYYNYNFLSVPEGDSGKRHVFIDGPIKGSEATNLVDTNRIIDVLSSIETSKRISGKLGVESPKEKDNREEKKKTITIKQRVIVFRSKTRPSPSQYAAASVVASLRTGFYKLTEKNIQDYVNKNDADLLTTLKEMGFDCYFGKQEEVNINLDIINKYTVGIVVKVNVLGDEGALPPDLKVKINEYKNKVKKYSEENISLLY